MPKQLKVRKRKGKDLDEIAEDMTPSKTVKRMQEAPDPDLPGEGRFYCVECARHFVSQPVLDAHRKSKLHKQRVKELKQRPYTTAEAEAAGGVGSFEKYTHNTKMS